MNSKRSLVLVSLLGVSLPAFAGDLNNIAALAQNEFRLLSEDLGSALSYKPLTPTTPLGLTGFDLGLAVTSTKLQNKAAFTTATAGAGDLSNIIVPSLRLHKGLPFGIDVGIMYSAVPSTNIKLVGGEVRYAIVSGGVATPAIGIRGSYTKLGGVDELEFNTRSVDLSISKGFVIFTPYAGIGKVWATSTPVGAAAPVLSKESFSVNKTFVGLNMNFGLMNVALEGDKTGDATTYGAKLGFRF